MQLLSFTVLVFFGSVAAGLLGSLTGLGGAAVLTPLLTCVFHVDLRYAIGASLVAVIATSSGAAAAYLREGFSNVRIGMFLEVATTAGAVLGAILAPRIPVRGLAILFGAVLVASAWLSWRQRGGPDGCGDDLSPAARDRSDRLRLSGSYPCRDAHTGRVADRAYRVDRIASGFGIMFAAGSLSGLLGLGSGAVKVLAMDRVMRIPFKVSTTTSNFMIGVTAAASAGIYLHRGYIAPGLAFPVMLGVLAGSSVGARWLVRAHVPALRAVFTLVTLALGVEMVLNGWLGRL